MPPDASGTEGRLLRGVPVFTGLSRENRERLAALGTNVTVAAGDWLLREGDEADVMYVIRSGRLDVLVEGPPETLVRTLRRGDVVGELALLHAGRRTASVRARRDSVLLEVSRAQFEALVRQEPGFAVGLTRALGAQLAASRAPIASAPPPRTIAVVRLDAGAPGPDAVERLAAGLRSAGTLARLEDSEGTEAERLGAIERAEREAERVLLVAGPADEAWTGLCLREADLILALTSGVPDMGWRAHSPALQGCELLSAGGAPSPSVLASLQPREVQVISDPDRLGPALDSTARRLTGRAVGVVLSGGGARAFAHLGVLEELCAAGLVIDRVGGVSLGAAVAAGIATGADPEAVYSVFRESFANANPTGDYAVPAYALLRGGRVRRMLAESFEGLRIEELPVRFFCLSCDLVSREAVEHRTGPLHEAVYASLAIPALFPPSAGPDGGVLVDGGVLDNLPVAAMARSGEGPVIASDVTGRVGSFRRAGRPRLVRLAGRVRRTLTGTETELPRLGETIVRAVTVGSIDTVAAARLHADVVISPEVDGVGLMDWKRLDSVRELGRHAAQAALPDLDRLLRA